MPGDDNTKPSEVPPQPTTSLDTTASTTEMATQGIPATALMGMRTTATNAGSQSYPNPDVAERQNFLLFIKVLFKILHDANEPETKSQAQRIVMECRRRSQRGDRAFVPLMPAVERRLRVVVGEAKWRRAHVFVHHFMANQATQKRSAVNNTIRQTAIAASGK